MTCEHAREQFSALIDDVLSSDERRACEEHIAECAACAREWQRFKQAVTILRAMGPVRAPAGFVDRVMQAARPIPWYRRTARWLVFPLPVKLPLEAAVLLLVGISAAYLLQHVPEQQQAFQREMPARGVAARPAPPSVTPAHPLPQDVAPPPAVSAPPAPSAPVTADRAMPSTASPLPPTAPPRRESPDVSERAVRRAAPQGAKEMQSELRARAYTRGDVSTGASGALVVSDLQRALNDVADVLTRLGGAIVSQSIRDDEVTVEARVPGQSYPAFAGALEKLGTWTPRDIPTSPPPTLFITLHITR